MPTTYTIGYRTGGTENFEWHRIGAYRTYSEAQKVQERISAQGYPAVIYTTAQLDAVGLPETFSDHAV